MTAEVQNFARASTASNMMSTSPNVLTIETNRKLTSALTAALPDVVAQACRWASCRLRCRQSTTRRR
jgi:hypothetical protein